MTAGNIVTLLDLNDNGALGVPDLLGWVAMGPPSVLGVCVVAGLILLAVLGVLRGTVGLGRAAASGVRRLADRG